MIAADNTFAVNSVIRNYTLYNRLDVEYEICEYADAGGKLMLMYIGATW